MIELGKEYVFSYCVECANDTDEDIEILISCDGLSCRVIGDIVTSVYGNMYEVESCTGSEFYAFENELKELKDERLCYWAREEMKDERIYR